MENGQSKIQTINEPGARKKRRAGQGPRLSITQTLVLGFAAVILTGAVLLWLPFSDAPGRHTAFIDALFTSTSAVCVTGLVVVDTATHFNTLGHVVIMLLIQVGGLGIMTFSLLAVMLAGGRVSYRFRLILKEALNRLHLRSIASVAVRILVVTLVFEGVGALILSIRWIPEMGAVRGAWFGLFHAVSAFCNAGFALFTNSMMPYRNDITINFAICSLIVLGGIGFTVILELYEERSFRTLSLHSRMALFITALLILGGAVLIFIFEIPSRSGITYHGAGDRALTAVFQSITARTAGFNTIDIGSMSTAGLYLLILLMFIGASPGGTGGGIKTTTFGALLSAMSAIVRGERDVTFFNRRISHDLLLRAFTITLLSLSLVSAVTLACSAFGGQDFLDMLFEVTSAFATVGLSAGITFDLSYAQKVLIILTMFCGRLGPLTMAMALASSAQRKQYRLPAEDIMIG